MTMVIELVVLKIERRPNYQADRNMFRKSPIYFSLLLRRGAKLVLCLVIISALLTMNMIRYAQ